MTQSNRACVAPCWDQDFVEALEEEQGVTEELGSVCDRQAGHPIHECFMEINKDLQDDGGDIAIKAMWTQCEDVNPDSVTTSQQRNCL